MCPSGEDLNAGKKHEKHPGPPESLKARKGCVFEGGGWEVKGPFLRVPFEGSFKSVL